MTVVHPGSRTRLHVGVLRDRDLPAVRALLDRDPLAHAVLAARLARIGSLDGRRLGGTTIGAHRGDELVAACFSGGNLLPIGDGATAAAAWPLLASFVANRPRMCTAISGRPEAVAGFWSVLAPLWGPPREIRILQPLLVIDREPDVPGDDAVVPVRPAQLERYLAAGAAMFAEELGISPYRGPAGSGFRLRMAEVIAEQRAFARVDFRGQVEFKAEIAAVTPATAQIHGVWVRPDLRGRGYGTSGLAAVIRYALRQSPTVSLYVNDFNHAARRVYAKLGMRSAGELSTVLL